MSASFNEQAESIRSNRIKEDPYRALINDYMIRVINVEKEMNRLIMDIQSMISAYDAEKNKTGKEIFDYSYKEQNTA